MFELVISIQEIIAIAFNREFYDFVDRPTTLSTKPAILAMVSTIAMISDEHAGYCWDIKTIFFV